MTYVTQGTVQVQQKIGSKCVTVINPIGGYTIKHRDKDYVVFLPSDCGTSDKPQDSRVYSIRFEFPLNDDGLRGMLTQAAIGQTKLEVEIDGSSRIIGVKAPARF